MTSRPHVVAVGVFDGLHRGHRRIIDTGHARALESRAGLAVVTFDPHPDAVLGKAPAELPLTPPREKKELLRAWGVDRVDVLPFDRELASLSADLFVEQYLERPLGLVRLVTGPDFALGRGRTGTVAHLEELGRKRGFAVETVPHLLEHHGPVSSTRVRGALRGGDVGFAAELLGRPYAIEGRVVHGWGIGEKLAFPTANLDPVEPKFLPADGIYAGWVTVPGDWSGPGPNGAVRGAISLGLRPTFDGTERTLEVHLLDWDKDVRDKVLRVEFVDWLRGQEKFEGAPALVEAMARDVARCRQMLAAAEAPKAP